jgi:succinate-acetate transporter protein
MSKGEDLKTQLWGWGLFVVCGFLFTLSGVRAQDMISTAASILFLLGCVVFIIPLVQALIQGGQ